MTIHRCPEDICRLFDGANEKTKSEARLKAIQWLSGQPVETGDTILMPDGETGALMEFEKHEVAS